MSDNDMISKTAALEAVAGWEIPSTAIAALPAVTVGVKPDRETFDAMCAMRDAINEFVPMPSLESDLLQGPENSVFCATVAEAVINEVTRLRSMTNGARLKRLEWHTFDAWTHWAEAVCGTYHVEERNGQWRVELRVGGLVHAVTETDDTLPADLEAAKAAAQADYEARILAALDLTPAPDAAAIREAWGKAYWRMRSYAIHDNDCKLNKPPHFNGPCSCGLTAALEEALALIPKGGNGRRVYMGQIMAECDCPREAECQAAGRCIAEERR